jgi:DNA-binding NtrC family response regulator
MLDRIKTELPEIQVIILTAHDSLHNASVDQRGAYHFIKTMRARRTTRKVERRWKNSRSCRDGRTQKNAATREARKSPRHG